MAVGLAPPQSLSAITGLRIATLWAGIYPNRRPDIALVELCEGASCGAVFTRNAFAAAPVIVAREHLESFPVRYCLINAGNANAGTGEQGLADARRTCAAVAREGSCRNGSVLPFSTGVIGEHLPVQKIEAVVPDLYRELDADNWLALGRAIMTTDTVAKGLSHRVDIAGKPVTITGVAKGAGMIRPDMATMLAFIATDAGIDGEVLDAMLHRSVERSFNRICIDGDMSTNDACVLFATGRADLPRITDPDSQTARDLQQALDRVTLSLAQAIVRDGEGATKFITVSVEEGRSSDECLKVAYTVATSPLVKTAFFASDPNWGRILASVGCAGLQGLDISRVSLYLNDVCIASKGARDPSYKEDAGRAVMSQEEILVRIILARGEARETVWTSDLSHEYVRINAEYRT
jgi:glutamate N-acetyltransferase/amino-acid N-acetyltransferase